jgi:hypothetical protein
MLRRTIGCLSVSGSKIPAAAVSQHCSRRRKLRAWNGSRCIRADGSSSSSGLHARVVRTPVAIAQLEPKRARNAAAAFGNCPDSSM